MVVVRDEDRRFFCSGEASSSSVEERVLLLVGIAGAAGSFARPDGDDDDDGANPAGGGDDPNVGDGEPDAEGAADAADDAATVAPAGDGLVASTGARTKHWTVHRTTRAEQMKAPVSLFNFILSFRLFQLRSHPFLRSNPVGERETGS
jgi:hypothetical protein